jgi:RNA polymerase I-specific transcription initiation factor RRN6
MYYKGNVALTAGVKAVLSGTKDAQTTEFGDSFVTFGFETGSGKYKGLQDGVYVAAGRFRVEEGKTVVEYRVGRVGV